MLYQLSYASESIDYLRIRHSRTAYGSRFLSALYRIMTCFERVKRFPPRLRADGRIVFQQRSTHVSHDSKHRAAMGSAACVSEQQPQSELDLTGGVGRGTNRRSDAGDQLASAVEYGLQLGCQIGIVQNVEHFHPELSLQFLAP